MTLKVTKDLTYPEARKLYDQQQPEFTFTKVVHSLSAKPGTKTAYTQYNIEDFKITESSRGARWLSGRVSDSGARGPGFETYRRRVVSLSKTLYSPKVLVNYPGSDGSVPT